MATETKLVAVIEAEDKASAVINKVGGSVTGLSGKIKELSPVFKGMAVAGGVAFGAIATLAVTSFKAYADAQAETVITNQSLANSFKAMAGASLKTLQKELGTTKDVLGALQVSANEAGKSALKLGFDDETAARSFAKLFGITKRKTQALKELAIAEDLARFKNISLEEATQKLVLVHAGATKELKALGLEVDKDNTSVQNMDLIMRQTAGASLEFSKTAAGAMQIIKVNTDNLKESIGAGLAPAFTKIKELLVPLVQKFTEWAEKNPDLMAKILLVGGAVSLLVLGLGTLGLLLPGIILSVGLLTSTTGLFMTTLLPLIGIIGGFIAIIYMANESIKIWQKDSALVIAGVKAYWQDFKTFIMDVWNKIAQYFKDVWAGIKITFKEALNSILGYFKPLLDTLEKVWNKMQQIAAGVGGKIKKAGDFLIDDVGGGINKAVGNVGKFLGINDGIVQNGKIITTHPDDYIMATKNPGSFGGGKDININISGAILTEDAARVMGDMIISKLRLQLKF